MTILKKLIIDGFKSFERAVELPLFDGFNAIIGPNGSGKSNIMDALTFVLGRRSSALRSDKLTNLIFNGGHGKKPRTEASVSLVINNMNRIIPDIDEDEVILTRKVMASGSSSYRINNRTDSKQQIDKVLDAINIISDGHNIIKQGDITRIINMRPNERREIIDEVAGIKEYVRKKNKAIDELAFAEKKLGESRLILKEKKVQLKRLEKDNDAAQKHQSLQQKEELLLANIAFSRVKAIEAILKNTVDNISIKEKEYNGASKEVGGYDDKLDKMEEELEKLDEDLINSSGDMKKDNDRIKIERSIVERSSKMESYYREIKRLEEMINSLTIMKNTKTQDIRNHAVKTILDSDIAGIEGTISTLMSVEPIYQLAIETTAKSHLNDIIVQNENTALSCIRYLKENNAGRARLLPLERLNLYRTSEKSKIAAGMPGFIDYAINLIDYNPAHDKAFRQVFKDTLIAENMDAAKKVRGLKVVTLDGDQFNPEGSISGGSRKGQKRSESLMDFSSIKRYEDEKERLEQSIKDLHTEITDLEKIKLEKEKGDEKDSKELEIKKSKKLDLKEKIDNIKKNRRTNMEESILLEKELQDLRIRRARLEAEYDNLLIPYEKYKDRADLTKSDPEKLERELSKIERQIRQLGPINMKAIEEYKIFREDYDEFEKKINKLEEERKTIIDMIEEIEKKRKELFIETFNYISKEFTKIYQAIAEGEGSLELENENNVESGLIIKAQPKDKKLLIIDALSGGEKTMTSIAFLFAIMNYKPSPFYILDEIDAALDTENSKKIGNLVTKYSEKSQFLIISHNSALVQKAKRVYGITMKKGASTIIGIELEN